MDKFPEEVLKMQRQMIEYLKQVLRPTATHPAAQPPAKELRADLEIKTVDGFPWLSPLLPGIIQTKDELEHLLRRYLNAHYSKFGTIESGRAR